MEKTILGGWRGSGLWPVNMAKPLMSRLVLSEPHALQTPIELQKRKDPEDDNTFQTPKRSHEVRHLVVGLHKLGQQVDPTVRLLFRKVGRGFDQQNTKLAMAQARIEQLEHQINRLRPRKKQKITQDPNGRFVRIEQIIQTRIRMKEQLKPATVAALNASYDFESLCNQWQLE